MSDEERSSIDDIIDLYKRDVDVSLIVENLRRSVDERLEALVDAQTFIDEIRHAMRAAAGVTDFKALLRILSEADVEFVVIGGVAASIHGSARITFDLDVVYRRTRENIDRLVRALNPYHPCPCGAPPGLRFRWDAATVQRGLNFALTTDIGALNALGEIVGGGGYDALLPSTRVLRAFGIECRLLNLDPLIEVTRAAGRPKDFEAIAELETVRDQHTPTTV